MPKTIKQFTASELAPLFNEWMRRFTEEPEAYQAQFKTVQLFLAEQQAGHAPSYGESSVAYLDRLRAELVLPAPASAPAPLASRRNRKAA